MGLFSFIKDIGKKIFKGKDETPEAKPEEVLAQQKASIKSYIEQLGLAINNFDCTIDDQGNVTLTGECASRADFEKISLTAGNIAGVAQVDNQMTITATEPARESSYYTVEKGDTLWAIATKNYGDGTKYPIIFEANVPMIKDADEIYPGQVLRIPALDEATA